MGKSTLLQAIAKRELRLPSHVTILHVEQEVAGDDTTALDSVLECDEERSRLLRMERELVGGGREEERYYNILCVWGGGGGGVYEPSVYSFVIVVELILVFYM